MAFVDITTPKSPVAVAVPLLQCRAGKRAFMPEVCQEVLQSTNFAKNIRDMLTMIAELSAEKQTDFKDVVLSTFDQREQPNDIVVLGKKLAVAGGYEAELNNVGKIGDVEGEYLLSGVGKQAGIAVFELYESDDYSKYNEIFIASDKVWLWRVDLSKVKKLRFKDGAEVDLSEARNLPEDIDVSMCDYVDLSNYDLSKVKKLRFKDGARVKLFQAKNLPADLDVSMCDYVDFRECDLSPVKNLCFKDSACVNLSGAQNLPEDLDISMCKVVDLGGCDLSTVKNLQLKSTEAWLSYTKNLPEVLDVSMCHFVSLFGCDLSKVKEIRFREGAEVGLSEAQNLPEDLDISMCGVVNLCRCDLSTVKNLRFKNRAQCEGSHAKIPGTVKVTYSEDDGAFLEEMLRDRGGR